MPHFIIDCSEDILLEKTPEEIMAAVYQVATSSGLFAVNDVKVRLRPFQFYKLGDGKKNFIHIFGFIMEGRSIEQKKSLSQQIVSRLREFFPAISFLSINISEFEFESYCNKSLINPENIGNDRHFEL